MPANLGVAQTNFPLFISQVIRTVLSASLYVRCCGRRCRSVFQAGFIVTKWHIKFQVLQLIMGAGYSHPKLRRRISEPSWQKWRRSLLWCILAHRRRCAALPRPGLRSSHMNPHHDPVQLSPAQAHLRQALKTARKRSRSIKYNST